VSIPAVLHPGKNPGALRISGWLGPKQAGKLWRGEKSVSATGIRIPDRPTRSLIAISTNLHLPRKIRICRNRIVIMFLVLRPCFPLYCPQCFALSGKQQGIFSIYRFSWQNISRSLPTQRHVNVSKMCAAHVGVAGNTRMALGFLTKVKLNSNFQNLWLTYSTIVLTKQQQQQQHIHSQVCPTRGP
jgi:hypothetical protein